MSFDIEKLYKENIDSSVPDMDKLWDRIENRLDEQEKADSKTEHHDITPSARPKRKLVSLITVAACAVIAVTGAFVIMNGNKLSTDSSSANSTRNASDKNVNHIIPQKPRQAPRLLTYKATCTNVHFVDIGHRPYSKFHTTALATVSPLPLCPHSEIGAHLDKQE